MCLFASFFCVVRFCVSRDPATTATLLQPFYLAYIYTLHLDARAIAEPTVHDSIRQNPSSFLPLLFFKSRVVLVFHPLTQRISPLPPHWQRWSMPRVYYVHLVNRFVLSNAVIPLLLTNAPHWSYKSRQCNSPCKHFTTTTRNERSNPLQTHPMAIDANFTCKRKVAIANINPSKELNTVPCTLKFQKTTVSKENECHASWIPDTPCTSMIWHIISQSVQIVQSQKTKLDLVMLNP